MTLSALIRKRETGDIATAIPAIAATPTKGNDPSVAGIATVAVANSPAIHQLSAPLSPRDERQIRAWLAMIDARGSSPGYSSDQMAVDELVDKARHDADARDYFVGRAQAELGLKNPDLIRS